MTLQGIWRAGYEWKWGASFAAVKRLRGALKGEAVSLMTLAFMPFLVLRLLDLRYGASYVESYGVAHRVVYLLSAPYFAGLVLVARERKEGDLALSTLLEETRPAFVSLCQIPLILSMGVLVFFWKASWVSDVMALAYFSLALRTVITVSTRGLVLRHRFEERSHVTGVVELISSGALGGLLLLALPRWIGLEAAFFVAVAGPGLAYVLLLKGAPRPRAHPCDQEKEKVKRVRTFGLELPRV